MQYTSVSNVPISMVRNYVVMGWKQDSDQPDNTPPGMRVSPGGNGTSVRDPIGEGCSHGAGILPLGGPEILSIGPKRSGAGDLDRPDELCAGPRRPFFGISSGAGDLDLSRKLSVGPSSSMPFFGISSGAGDLDLSRKLSVGPSSSMPFFGISSGAGDLDLPLKLSVGPSPSMPFFGISSGAGDLDLPLKLSVGPSPSMPFLGISSGAGDLDLPGKLSVGPNPNMGGCWSGIGDLLVSLWPSPRPKELGGAGGQGAVDTADVGLLLSDSALQRAVVISPY